MARENLIPIPISSLGIITDPKGFWVLGSKEDADGFESGRYSLDQLIEYAQQIQLERRLSYTMNTSQLKVYIDEPMTIYKATGSNVSDLTITVGSIDNNVSLDTEISVNVPAKSIVTLTPTRTSTSGDVYLYIYAKVKQS